jgi:hypothetical protein
MARVDPQYLQSCQAIEGEGDRDTAQEKKRPRLEEGFRGRGLTAEQRWDLLSNPTQLEIRERTKNNLSPEDLQWAAIQIRKESQLLQFERVVTEEMIAWRWTVEDLGWKIMQSLPPITGSMGANTHIHMTNSAPRRNLTFDHETGRESGSTNLNIPTLAPTMHLMAGGSSHEHHRSESHRRNNEYSRSDGDRNRRSDRRDRNPQQRTRLSEWDRTRPRDQFERQQRSKDRKGKGRGGRGQCSFWYQGSGGLSSVPRPGIPVLPTPPNNPTTP